MHFTELIRRSRARWLRKKKSGHTASFLSFTRMARMRKGAFLCGLASVETTRAWVLREHSRNGSTYIVDGVPVKDATPAAIAQALNTQEPKVLSVMDALREVATKQG
jgi:hypothetical protein